MACWIEKVEGQKKVVYEPKVKTASMTCKSKEKKEELLWALEMERENGAPIVLHDLIIWINQVMKDFSFTSVKNSFEIMAAKYVPYFEREKD